MLGPSAATTVSGKTAAPEASSVCFKKALLFSDEGNIILFSWQVLQVEVFPFTCAGWAR
jgi:hypothetical protein